MGDDPLKITYTMKGKNYCPLKGVSVEERALLLMWKQIVPGCHFKEQSKSLVNSSCFLTSDPYTDI